MLRLCFLLVPLAIVACAATSSGGGRAGGDRGRLLDFLKSHAIAHDEVAAGNGSLLVVPAWGARVIGAFFDGDNVFWVPPDLSDPKEWNKGGARTWLAPEGHAKGFFFDKTWAPDKWSCPAAIDPGQYQPAEAARAGGLAYANELRALSNDGTPYHLRVTREIGSLPNPVSPDVAPPSVKYVGFRFAHRLKNLSDRTIHQEIGLWSLIMVKPGGTMVVPVKADAEGGLYRDNYYERVPPGWITDNWSALTMKVAGPPRYKIGVPAARCRGLTGSITALPDGSWQAIVKRFPWDPHAVYADRPQGEPKSNGDPIQTYNHKEGGAMAFYELECHAPAFTLKPQEEREHPIEILIYRGPEEPIKKIASALFGVNVETLKLY